MISHHCAYCHERNPHRKLWYTCTNATVFGAKEGIGTSSPSMGFKLTKLVSKVPDQVDRIDGSALSKVIVSYEESRHVLGLKWDHINDTLVASRVLSAPSQKL